jgi:hypothetical protein
MLGNLIGDRTGVCENREAPATRGGLSACAVSGRAVERRRAVW